MHSTEDGEGHAEIKLSDDSAEAEDQVDGSPTFRPALLQQNRRNLCFFVMGMLLVFCIGKIIIVIRNVVCEHLRFDTDTNICYIVGLPGYIVAYISQGKSPAEPVSCEPKPKMTTVSQTQATAAPLPAALPAEETELQWQDITQLLKQKLTSQSFKKTLRYFQHEPV